jgi:hypothetical protein
MPILAVYRALQQISLNEFADIVLQAQSLPLFLQVGFLREVSQCPSLMTS